MTDEEKYSINVKNGDKILILTLNWAPSWTILWPLQKNTSIDAPTATQVSDAGSSPWM